MAARRRSRHSIGRWRAGAAAFAVGLCGCQSTTALLQQRQWHTVLPARVAAWVAAEVCRETLPGADPIGQDAGAPIVAGDRFVVCYSRTAGEGFRVAMNGRLVPRTEPSPSAGLPSIAFVPAPRTRSNAGGSDRLVVVVRADGTGATLALEVAGAALSHAVDIRLRQALDSAEAIAAAAERIRAGDREGAMTLAQAAMSGGDGLPRLAAIARVLRAGVMASDGRLQRARELASQALLSGGASIAARRLRRALDRRLAYDRPGPSLPLSPVTREDGVQPLETDSRARGQASERRGDLVAAERWWTLAAAAPERNRDDLLELARVYDRADDPRRAYETRLLALELGADRGSLAAELYDDCLRLHDPGRALRWLALDRQDDALVEARMRTAARRSGERLTRGILYTSAVTPSGVVRPSLALIGASAEQKVQRLLAASPDSGEAGLGADPPGFAATPR